MKGGLLRFRGKELSLVLIVLICATVLLWSWEGIPLLNSVLPPNDLLWVSPVAEVRVEDKQVLEIVENVNSDSSVSLPEREKNDGLNRGGETVIRREQILDVEDRHELEVGKKLTSQSSTKLAEVEGMQRQNLGEENVNRQEEILDVAAPLSSANSSFSVILKDPKNLKIAEDYEACDYAKGKWIIDNSRRPLYSGSGCKQWLSPMWACRLMQREDFEYEKLRWQPKNCQMEEFESSKFLERMKGKTIAIVGDSLGRQQFQSLMCMITEGEERLDVIDVGSEYGFVKPEGGIRPDGWAYRFPSANTTVLYHWSACLCDLEPINITNPVTDYAMHLDRPPSFLRRYLHDFDVLVLNTGHHWNRGKINANRWVMYVGGMPNTNRKLAMVGEAKNFTIHSIVRWVNSQFPKYPRLKAFYRSISPRHFVNGDWNTGGSCDNTTPISVGKEVLQDESSDYSAGNAVKGTGVMLLDITALSQLRDEGHISKFSITAAPGVQDCLHWCLPGVPDTWNEILFAKVSAMSSVQTV